MADLIEPSKTTVLPITCSIHSSETASTLMALELLHEMATREDPEAVEIRDRTILLLIPSVNPDGVDLVRDWYERSKGTPWEGSGMPWLYHHYAGHDTNRDWFMLNLQETRVLSRFLYQGVVPDNHLGRPSDGLAGPPPVRAPLSRPDQPEPGPEAQSGDLPHRCRPGRRPGPGG